MVLGLLSAAAFACNSGEDLPTASGSAAPSGSPSPTASGTVGPTATPSTTVPPGWVAYTDPYGQFTVSHPPGWFETEREFSSVDPSMIEPGVESFDVEFSLSLDDGHGCGVLHYDLTTGVVSPDPNATTVQLGGVAAWKLLREPGDPGLNEYTRIEAISTIYNGYCFNIVGYFTQQDPDVNVFSQITSTFQFTF
jgi:hypothetical protein